MASRFLNGGIADYTQNFINIDTLLDVLTQEQKQANIEPIAKLKKDFMVDEEDKQTSHNCKSCGKCNINNSNKSNHPFAALLGYVNDEDDDDEDDFYRCELCDALGYRGKYDSSICDSCTLCESCEQYIDDDCSGCSYSVYRDGMFYRDKMSESDLIDPDDLQIFNELKDKSSERLSIDEPFRVSHR